MSGEYSLVRKDGTVVVVEFCAVAGIRPGVHLSILHDVTARVRLERRVRLAASFQEATAALNAAVDVEQVAAVVLSTGLTSLGARAGHLVMIGDDGWAEVVAQAGVDESDESHWAISCPSLGVAHDRVDGRFRFAFDTRSVLHRAFERGGPIGIQRVVDLDVDPRVQQGLSRLGTAMSCIPLVVSGRLIGGLYLYWPARDDFSDEERYCASTLAAMGAQSLDRARLHAQVKAAHRTAVATADRIMDQQSALEHMAFDRVMVEERERRRIATALHDGVGQYLALAKMALDPVRRRVDGEHGEALTRCLGLVEAAIEEARSLTFDLSPPMLYELGLAPALSALGEKLAETTGFGVDVAADDGALDLDEVTAVIVFRSVRELLMNVVKHSGSASARVRLAREAGRLSVAIEDAGRGFDLAKVTSKRRFGLMSVHEQIVRLGGAVDVTSGPGGTRVVLDVPLRNRD
jgi:signal transduction histidine kinase